MVKCQEKMTRTKQIITSSELPTETTSLQKMSCVEYKRLTIYFCKLFQSHGGSEAECLEHRTWNHEVVDLSPALTGTKLKLFFGRLLFKLNFSVMLVNSHLVYQPSLVYLSLLCLFESPHLTTQGKPSPGTLRGKGRGADQETHGAVT